jgi:SAM-dependent methyltransferase
VKESVDGAEVSGAGKGRRRLPGLTVRDGYTQHPFDVEFAVRTSGLVAGRHLETGQHNDRYNTAYYGVAPSVLRALLGRWRRGPEVAPLDQYTFIDLGAGMGRAVMVASEYRFRRVIGVELNPALAGMARRNLTIWRRAGRAKAPTSIRCADAADYAFPTGPCLAFLFNPFAAPVLRRVLTSAAATFADRTRQFDLLYVNHEHEDVLKRHGGFSCLYSGQVMRSRGDAIADHTILANQPDGEYASANYEDCSIWRWVGRSQKP